jgi:hypothetical protein
MRILQLTYIQRLYTHLHHHVQTTYCNRIRQEFILDKSHWYLFNTDAICRLAI